MKIMKSKTKTRKPALPRVGTRLIAALTELRDVLASGEPLDKHFTVHTVARLPSPTLHDASTVLATREKLGASQAVFAELVGVSKIQAQSWEQGVRKPSKLACRLLDEINRDPKHWRRMMGAA